MIHPKIPVLLLRDEGQGLQQGGMYADKPFCEIKIDKECLLVSTLMPFPWIELSAHVPDLFNFYFVFT